MEKIWKGSIEVFLLQVVGCGLMYGVSKNPFLIFVVSTLPVFVDVAFDESIGCYGVIALLSVIVAAIFSGDDAVFVGVVAAIALTIVSIVVAGIGASDAKLYREAREPMLILFLAGLPYGIGVVVGASHFLSLRRVR